MCTRSMTRSPIIGITRPSFKRRVFFSFFFGAGGGGGVGGVQKSSMINVALETPIIPGLGSLCLTKILPTSWW